MTIAEMHVYFRQYAQQMGMQEVRSILPEQIDVLLNTSISDTINQLIKEHISATNDKTISGNSKIGQVNALKPLYKVKTALINGTVDDNGNIINSFSFNPKDKQIGLIRYNASEANNINILPNCLFLVDFSLSYRQSITGIETNNLRTELPQFDDDSEETRHIPIRVIDESYLADTLNDFVLKNRFKSPIMVIYNDTTIDIYSDKFIKKTIDNKTYYTLKGNYIPYELKISYIDHPNKVKYSKVIEDSVDCDLPESMHINIVKHAVDLYRIAVNGMQQIQQQNRDQTAGDTRNNYRNESY